MPRSHACAAVSEFEAVMHQPLHAPELPAKTWGALPGQQHCVLFARDSRDPRDPKALELLVTFPFSPLAPQHKSS